MYFFNEMNCIASFLYSLVRNNSRNYRSRNSLILHANCLFKRQLSNCKIPDIAPCHCCFLELQTIVMHIMQYADIDVFVLKMPSKVFMMRRECIYTCSFMKMRFAD